MSVSRSAIASIAVQHSLLVSPLHQAKSSSVAGAWLRKYQSASVKNGCEKLDDGSCSLRCSACYLTLSTLTSLKCKSACPRLPVERLFPSIPIITIAESTVGTTKCVTLLFFIAFYICKDVVERFHINIVILCTDGQSVCC